ncbi:MAG: tRNA-(ms[2]io[6]A)-hydroxylase [Flavobacteriales bacterium]
MGNKHTLGLKLPTDPRWAALAEENIEELLIDHAFCEQKAASNAISISVKFPEYSEVVEQMIDVAREELEHYGRVHRKILERGWVLGKERKDPYVKELMKFMKKGGSREAALVEQLLLSAMIEARSCERFKLLTERIADEDLKSFYYELMVSEAGHYRLFLDLARKYGEGIDVDARWQEYLDQEARIVAELGKESTMHG